MDNIEKIWIQLEAKVDKKTFDNAEKDVEIFARDTQKKLDKAVLLDLEINKTKLQIQLQDLNKTLAKAKKEWNEELRFNTQLDINKLSSSLTEAKRQFNNYVNTWDTGTSRLQAKFNQVTSEIKKSRDELASLWKNTSWFDKILKKADTLQQELKDWKITASQYSKSLEDLKTESATNWFNKLNSSLWNLVKGFIWLNVLSKVKDYFVSAWKTAISFESAFAWVTKTISGTPEQLETLNNNLKALSTRIPIPYEDLAQIAQLWGQLGVWIWDIEKFVETIWKISVSTNLTREQAWEDFAVIANITKEPLSNLDRMASAVVYLWNNFATQEDKILSFAKNIAGAWELAWLSASDIFWISAAFSSVWIEAEAWWSAVQKTLLDITNAVNNWWDSLQKYASVAGQSSEEFARGWKENAWQSFTDFIKWLWQAWTDWNKILADLVWTDVRLQRAFLSLANNSDILTQAINWSNKAFEDNIALQKEAEARFNTTESKIIMQQNKWRLFKDFLWKEFLPTFVDITEFFTNILPTAFLQTEAWLQILENKMAILLWNIIKFINNTTQQIGAWAQIWLNIALWSLLKWASQVWIIIWNVWSIIWTSFSNIPFFLQEWLNATISLLETWVNKIIWWLNKIPNVNIWEIKFWWISGASIKETKSVLSWVKEFWWQIDSYITWLNNNIAKTTQSNLDLINAWIDGSTSYLESQSNQLALSTATKINQLKWLREQASAETKKQISEDIAKENELLKKYLTDLNNSSEKSWAWRKKTEEELQAEIEKIKQEALKKEIERQENLLKSEYANKITSVKNSELTEVEKAKKIVALNEELQDKIKKINIELIDDEVEKAKKILEIEEKANDKRKDLLDTLKDWYDKISDVLQDSIDKSKDNIDELKDKISDLSWEIKDLNEDIANLTTEKTTDILNRNVEITQRQAELQAELNDLKKEWINIDLASQIGETSLKSMQWDTSFGWENTAENLLKVIELQKELNSINQEQAKIQELVKNWDLKQSELDEALRVSKLSDTEKILSNYDIEKTKIETKIALKETELEAEKKKLESEYVAYNSLVLRQSQVDQNYKNIKMGIEKEITDNLYQEWVKREEILESLRLKALEVAEALKQAWLTSSTDTKSSTDDKSSTTNSKVINQTINISNEVDWQALLNNLNSKI